MIRSLLILVTVVSGILFSRAGVAAENPAQTRTASDTTSASLPADDMGFVREALQGGRREVASSREVT